MRILLHFSALIECHHQAVLLSVNVVSFELVCLLFIFFDRLESVQNSRRNIMAGLIFCWSSFCVRHVLRSPALYEAEFDIQISSSTTANRTYKKRISLTCN
jgi:hypothetical protein